MLNPNQRRTEFKKKQRNPNFFLAGDLNKVVQILVEIGILSLSKSLISEHFCQSFLSQSTEGLMTITFFSQVSPCEFFLITENAP